MNTQEKLKELFRSYTDEQLITMAEELSMEYIPESSEIRNISKEIHKDDQLVHLIGIGVPLAKELSLRLKPYSDIL